MKDWNGNEEDYINDFVPVKGYEDRLLINRKGQVYSLLTHKILKYSILPSGYIIICLMIQKPKRHTKTLYIHRLLADTFIANPQNKPQVNHIVGNKSNNNLSNLEWVTQSENNQHAIDIGLRKPNIVGFTNYNASHAVLSLEEILFIKKHTELSVKELSEKIKNNHLHAIYDCKKGKSYKQYNEVKA